MRYLWEALIAGVIIYLIFETRMQSQPGAAVAAAGVSAGCGGGCGCGGSCGASAAASPSTDSAPTTAQSVLSLVNQSPVPSGASHPIVASNVAAPVSTARFVGRFPVNNPTGPQKLQLLTQIKSPVGTAYGSN